MKVLFTGNYTMDFIANSFEQICKIDGLSVQINKSGFNQYKQDILSKVSILYEDNFNIIYLCLDLYTLIEDLIYTNEKNIISKIISRLEEEIGFIEIMCSNLPGCHFFIDGFYYYRAISMATMEYNSSYSISEIEGISNNMLQKLITNTSNASIIDVRSMIKSHGREKLFDERMYYIAKSHWSLTGVELLCKLYLRYLKAYLGVRKKCIVVDLDNTLWGGIIGDDGIENIVLSNDGSGKAFYDFQRELLKLYQRGILLAICSKNTEEIALDVFVKHPYMILKLDHFISKKINWKNKAENIKEIAVELNIGLDSIVYLDDSPYEREIVSNQLPQLVVPQLPEDPSEYTSFLQNLGLFDLLDLTDNDLNRNKDYIDNIRRETLKSQSDDIEDYYCSLEMVAKIGIIGNFHIPRIAQMTQKTNQFNLRTIRYTEQDIRAMQESPNYRIFYLALSDKFGDNGIVGAVILKLNLDLAFIDTFIMSCRVLGRTAETAFLNYVMTNLSKFGIKKVKSEFIRTNKNVPCAEFLQNHGFERITETEWLIDLENYIARNLPWIKIKEENYE